MLPERRHRRPAVLAGDSIINRPRRMRADRDQLFAEAVQLFKSGAKWWPDKDFEAEHINPEQEARFETDPWQEAVEAFLDEKKKTTVERVARGALGIETARIGTADARRIRGVLTSLKWTGKRGHGGVRWYHRLEAQDDDSLRKIEAVRATQPNLTRWGFWPESQDGFAAARREMTSEGGIEEFERALLFLSACEHRKTVSKFTSYGWKHRAESGFAMRAVIGNIFQTACLLPLQSQMASRLSGFLGP